MINDKFDISKVGTFTIVPKEPDKPISGPPRDPMSPPPFPLSGPVGEKPAPKAPVPDKTPDDGGGADRDA